MKPIGKLSRLTGNSFAHSRDDKDRIMGIRSCDERTQLVDEIFRIFEIDPGSFGASYEAFLKVIHPEDRSAVDNTFTSSVNNKLPYEISHRLVMPDGRIKFVREKGETFYDDGGKPLRSIGTVQDITAETESKIALERSRDNLQQAERLAQFGHYILMTGAGNILMVRRRVSNSAENPGVFEPTFDNILSLMHPDDRVRQR